MDNPSAPEWFSRHAAEFDDQYSQSPFFRQRQEVWGALVREFSFPGCRVLDVGCGTGAMVILAAPSASEVLAVDPSSGMLDLCVQRCEDHGITNCSFMLKAIDGLDPSRIDPFDLVLASSVLEYVDDLPRALARLAQLSVPGGTLLVSLPNTDSVLRALERVAYSLLRRPRYYGLVKNRPSQQCFRKMLTEVGFDLHDAHVYGLPGCLWPPERMARLSRKVGTMRVYVARRVRSDDKSDNRTAAARHRGEVES